MVDITDRHFRYMLRLMSKRLLLYTPMFVAKRIVKRSRQEMESMLRFHPSELPVAAQLGGDKPDTVAARLLPVYVNTKKYIKIDVSLFAGSWAEV